MHEDIWYFSYKIKKRPSFITVHKEQEWWKAFEQTQAFPPTRNFLPGWDGELTEMLAYYVLTRCSDSVKTKHPVCIMPNLIYTYILNIWFESE